MKIDESIRNEPEKWVLREHCFIHVSGVRLWVANGQDFLQIHPKSSCFGYFYRRRIWKAFKWWCNNAPLEFLAK